MTGTVYDELTKWPFTVAAALVAAGAGYAVWNLQQKRLTNDRFRDARETAYREVWETLQRAEVELRGSTSPDRTEALIREVNAAVMKHELVLEHDDRALARRYMKATELLARTLRESGNSAGIHDFARTDALSPWTPGVGEALSDFEAARERFRARASAAVRRS